MSGAGTFMQPHTTVLALGLTQEGLHLVLHVSPGVVPGRILRDYAAVLRADQADRQERVLLVVFAACGQAMPPSAEHRASRRLLELILTTVHRKAPIQLRLRAHPER